jgi:oligoendopeptidase F
MTTSQGKGITMLDVERKRDDVPAQYRWDLGAWFASTEAWEEQFGAMEGRLAALEGCRGILAQGPARLRECLDAVYDVRLALDWLSNFAQATFSTDRTIDAHKARLDRTQQLATRFDSTVSFLEPEILALPAETLARFQAGEPGLAPYRHYLEDLARRRAHVLTPDLERLLALTGDLRAGPYSLLNALHQDIEFPEVRDEDGRPAKLAMASFSRFRASPKREVRRQAVEVFFGTLRRYVRSLAASLDMQVKSDLLVARARGYSTAREASLDANAVPVAVYDLLLDTTARFLPSTLHRYVAVRKRLMKLEELHYYDLYNPLVPAFARTVPFEEAQRLVEEAVRPLGTDYGKVLAQGLTPGSGWTDVYPNRGKRSGAYCTAAYGAHPFVFLNYMDQLEDVFTTAHEYGHALHFYLSHATQPYPTSDAPIFLAEIASTFNEEMLLSLLLSRATQREERLALLNKRLENIRTTIFRQIMFAEFELLTHREVEQGGALTAERLNELYLGVVRKFYGPDFTPDPDDAVEWSYVPHFYYNFYVYQYATGLMSAIALSQKVQRGEAGAVERYLAFLRAGNQDFPLETLRAAGVDFATPAAMEETFRLFERTLDEFEKLSTE